MNDEENKRKVEKGRVSDTGKLHKTCVFSNFDSLVTSRSTSEDMLGALCPPDP